VSVRRWVEYDRSFAPRALNTSQSSMVSTDKWKLTIVDNNVRHPQLLLDLVKDALHRARVAKIGGQDEVGVLGYLFPDRAGYGCDLVAFALEERDGCRSDVGAGAEEEEGVLVGHGEEIDL
jgi:hypothetical protein